MQSKISSPQSICILRLSAIGDVCHAVAAVQAIQRRWPEAKITWVIGKVELMLLEGLTGVEFILFDKSAGLKGYRDLRNKLANRRFDILLHMQVALRASGAALCIRAKEKWGFDKQRAKEGQWLFCNRSIKTQHEPHVADGFMAFARAIGVKEEGEPKWKMPIAIDELDWQRQKFDSTGHYFVIAAAASKAERNWMPERYAAIANHAHNRGFSVVLCGGPTAMEKELANKIETHCQFKPINLVGQTSLKQLLVVLKEAKLVLAPDTGPAHMAVTVGTPVIGLYAHSNPKRTGPYRYLEYVVSCYEEAIEEQTGRKPDNLPWGKRAKGEALMQNISVANVIECFDKIVDQCGLNPTVEERKS